MRILNPIVIAKIAAPAGRIITVLEIDTPEPIYLSNGSPRGADVEVRRWLLAGLPGNESRFDEQKGNLELGQLQFDVDDRNGQATALFAAQVGDGNWYKRQIRVYVLNEDTDWADRVIFGDFSIKEPPNFINGLYYKMYCLDQNAWLRAAIGDQEENTFVVKTNHKGMAALDTGVMTVKDVMIDDRYWVGTTDMLLDNADMQHWSSHTVPDDWTVTIDGASTGSSDPSLTFLWVKAHRSKYRVEIPEVDTTLVTLELYSQTYTGSLPAAPVDDYDLGAWELEATINVKKKAQAGATAFHGQVQHGNLESKAVVARFIDQGDSPTEFTNVIGTADDASSYTAPTVTGMTLVSVAQENPGTNGKHCDITATVTWTDTATDFILKTKSPDGTVQQFDFDVKDLTSPQDLYIGPRFKRGHTIKVYARGINVDAKSTWYPDNPPAGAGVSVVAGGAAPSIADPTLTLVSASEDGSDVWLATFPAINEDLLKLQVCKSAYGAGSPDVSRMQGPVDCLNYDTDPPVCTEIDFEITLPHSNGVHPRCWVRAVTLYGKGNWIGSPSLSSVVDPVLMRIEKHETSPDIYRAHFAVLNPDLTKFKICKGSVSAPDLTRIQPSLDLIDYSVDPPVCTQTDFDFELDHNNNVHPICWGRAIAGSGKGVWVKEGSSPLACTATATPTGLVVAFTSTPSGGTPTYVYDWDYGDGTTHGTTQNPSHTYASPGGNFNIVLTVTDSLSATVVVSLSVNAIVSGGQSPLPVLSAAPTSGSPTLAVTFTRSCSGGTANYSWVLNYGDGTTPGSGSAWNGGAATTAHNYTTKGVFTAVLTVTDAVGATGTVSMAIVTDTAQVVATLSASPSTGAPTLAVTFTRTGTGGSGTFSWDLDYGDGTAHGSGSGWNGASGTTAHNYTAAGTYTAVFKITDGSTPPKIATATAVVTVVTAPPGGSGNQSCYAGTQTNWGGSGATGAPNSVFASYIIASGASSTILTLSGYGFAIPTGATIQGIILTTLAKASINGFVFPSSLSLTKTAGTAVGSDYALQGDALLTTKRSDAFGNSSDLWGTTWTVAQINASGFGCVIVYDNNDSVGRSCSMDSVMITVYYTT